MTAATPQLAAIAGKLRDSMRGMADELVASTDENGKVVVDGQWTLFQQGCALVFAEIYKDEGGSWCGSAEVLTKLEKSVDYLLSLLDERGEAAFSDGKWSGERMIPSWEIEGYVGLLRWHQDILSGKFKARLKDGLARLAAAHTRELPGERLHNIPGFAAAALWKVGEFFGEEAWKRVAREYLSKLAASQTPDGYWREHTGPTTVYNLVYMSAMGTHHSDGGEVDVSDALRRGGAFHSRFVYPNGSPVSLVDGRVLYHGGPVTTGLPGVIQAESAAGYVERVANAPGTFGRPTSNASVFIPQTYRLIMSGVGPCVSGEPDSVPLGDVASVMEAGDFAVATSALTGACDLHEDCHWGYERLQHLEIHHNSCGVLLGGGHSQGPDMAFLLSDGVHLADSGRMEEGGRRLRLAYPWGEAVMETSVSTTGVDVSVEVSSRSPVRMLLPLLRGWVEKGRNCEPGRLSALEAGGVSLSVEPEAELVFPLKPWYTYDPEGEMAESGWRYGLTWSGTRNLKVALKLRD